MPKYIPGNPNIIIQNVAGAAGLIATNQVYNIAKPDGLTLGAIYPALYFEQLAKRPEAKFEWNKFNLDRQHRELEQLDVHAVRHALQNHRRYSHRIDAAKVRCHRCHIDRLLHAETPGRCHRRQVRYCARLCSGSDIDLAVERGEVMCRAFTVNAFFAREPFITWRKKNFVRVLYQTGSKSGCEDQRRSVV